MKEHGDCPDLGRLAAIINQYARRRNSGNGPELREPLMNGNNERSVTKAILIRKVRSHAARDPGDLVVVCQRRRYVRASSVEKLPPFVSEMFLLLGTMKN